MIHGCAIILSTFRDAPEFLITFLGAIPGFLVTFVGYSRIFGYHFLAKFDFFRNNPDFDFGILSLIFY